MKQQAPFEHEDLEELAACFYERAERVVAMEDVVAGDRAPNVIGLRHDCDAGHSLKTAVAMARWEASAGIRSTYFMLHTAPYWNYTWFPSALEEIAECGHEIGIHADALAASLGTGEDPDLILERALARLRELGHTIHGVAGHGNPICIRLKREHECPFANDEQFVECRRPDHGQVPREIHRGNRSLLLRPRPLADFGLEYEALWSAHPWSWRCSDSGGKWLNPGFEETAERFAKQLDVTELPSATEDPRQLHLLIHPDWWSMAFTPLGAVA